MYTRKPRDLVNQLRVIIRDCEDTKVSGLYADYRSDEENFAIQQYCADLCRQLILGLYKYEERFYVRTGRRDYMDQDVVFEAIIKIIADEYFSIQGLLLDHNHQLVTLYVIDRLTYKTNSKRSN